MDVKKSKKAQLGSKGGLYFNAGLVVALAFTIMAFEWKSYGDIGIVDYDLTPFEEDEWVIPPTVDEIKPPKPKPKVAPTFVETEEDIEIDLPDIDIDINPDDFIPEYTPEPPVEDLNDEPLFIVESMPEFEGGYSAFFEYVGKKMKYPSQARRMGIEGKVFVEFVINRDGKITEVKAIKGIGAGCDEEAMRVLKNAPAWKPGKQRGVPVRVKMVLPITFKLG